MKILLLTSLASAKVVKRDQYEERVNYLKIFYKKVFKSYDKKIKNKKNKMKFELSNRTM